MEKRNFRHITPVWLEQLFKYGLVGVLNTTITFVVIYVLQEWCGATPLVSNVVGYGAGLVNSFVLNSLWTFGTDTSWRRLGIFLAVWVPCYLANLLALYLLLRYTNLGAMWSQVVAMVVFNISNFLLNKFLTFKK